MAAVNVNTEASIIPPELVVRVYVIPVHVPVPPKVNPVIDLVVDAAAI